jgi:RNA polymerase sigma-70 factor, ECF subfamily
MDAANSAGDDASRARFAALYEGTAPALSAWAELRIRPAMRSLVDPTDIVQETWVRAWRLWPGFDERERPFRPWLFAVANRVLFDAFKAVRGRAAGGGARSPAWSQVPDEATSISRRVARDELLREFLDRLSTLEDDDRRLFVYRGLEGLPHEEVAARLSAAPSAVRKRWERLRARLVLLGLPAALGAAE